MAAIHPRRSSDAQVLWALREQEALRLVATLVARGASSSTALSLVVRELGRLLGAGYASIGRFESDATICNLAYWRDPSAPDIDPPFGGRWPVDEDTASGAVYRTGRPARHDAAAVSREGEWLRSHGVREVVACPVIVDDRLWGKVSLLFLNSRPVPEDAEARIYGFVELVSSTIAQAEYRAELITSRNRLVMASDAARRRIERDLHDGAQQRLIAVGLELREAEECAPRDDDALRRRLSNAASGLSEVLAQLQEISRGLHPAILASGGLAAAIKALVRRCPVSTELRIAMTGHLSERTEVTLYYVVSEALANVLKHANASVVRIGLSKNEDTVSLTIHDDGVGGADLRRGSGLAGLTDRVEAAGGTIEVSSPIGRGTTVSVRMPSNAETST